MCECSAEMCLQCGASPAVGAKEEREMAELLFPLKLDANWNLHIRGRNKMLTQNLVHVLLFITNYELHIRSFQGAVFLLQCCSVLSASHQKVYTVS